jgi:hypothetical protein
MAACGGSDGANDERVAQQGRDNQPADATTDSADARATVALSGCVEAAPGTDQYVLRNVRVEPPSGGDPQRDTTTSGALGITEGSWVRLDGGDEADRMEQFAGQRVTLTGTIADSGRNTIGTAGTSGVRTESGDRSRAAGDRHYSEDVRDEAGRIARESMANGTAAEVHVTAMQGTGEKCQAERR